MGARGNLYTMRQRQPPGLGPTGLRCRWVGNARPARDTPVAPGWPRAILKEGLDLPTYIWGEKGAFVLVSGRWWPLG